MFDKNPYMLTESLCKHFIEKFPYNPTKSQIIAFKLISKFLVFTNRNEILLIKGYAGTGKTKIISHVIKNLSLVKKKSVMLAPTGRAAKVLSSYSGKSAFTIHKKIYFYKSDLMSQSDNFKLKENKYNDTLFIVDESSLIGDKIEGNTFSEKSSLLNDLIQYVYSGDNCQLILVGDTAQLPPVNLSLSPALSEDVLELKFNCKTLNIHLTDVVRQKVSSGILFNATLIRNFLSKEDFEGFKFRLDGFNDIFRVRDGNDLLELLESKLNRDGIDHTVFIVRSNKRANLYNKNIREKILFLESDLSEGDQLMVVKNNYFWLGPDSKPGFIANGDVIRIKRIQNYINRYDMKFAEVNIEMVDYPDEPAFDTILLIDTLNFDSANLSHEQSKLFYQKVSLDYADEKSKYKRFLKVKKNPYFNSLQVKYSYSITCHKSQGGQWKNVFVEQPYLPSGVDKNYLRWLYTAMTRAKNNLFLVGFNQEYFS